MSFLLDTNICSAHLRRPSGLFHRFMQYSGRLHTSSVNLGELYAWAYLSADPTAVIARLHLFLVDLTVLNYDAKCAEQFGRLRGDLLPKGVSVSLVDLMIASVALSYDLTLVTHNTADFQRIPNLRLEDWLTP